MKLLEYEKLLEDLPKEYQKDYGKDLFGDFRKTGEKDTEKEKIIFKLILDFIEGSYIRGKKKLTSDQISYIKSLINLKKYEPEVLSPSSNILFRGSKLLLDTFVKIFKVKMSDFKAFEIENQLVYKYKNKVIYSPKSQIQSWTSDFKTSYKFSDYDIEYEQIGVIYKYKFTDDSIVFNEDFLNSIRKHLGQNKEYEVLHIGEKKLKCDLFLNANSYFKISTIIK